MEHEDEISIAPSSPDDGRTNRFRILYTPPPRPSVSSPECTQQPGDCSPLEEPIEDLDAQFFSAVKQTQELPTEAPTLFEHSFEEIKMVHPEVRARRIRRALAQGKWQGTPLKLGDPTERVERTVQHQSTSDADPIDNFYMTCADEVIELSWELHNDFLCRDPQQAFKIAIKKKSGKEVTLRHLSGRERAEMQKGMNKEVDSWLRYKVCRAVPRHMAKGRALMQMMWILTWKACGTGKGRIVVRGYQHEKLDSIRTESPTASKRARQLFFHALG